MNHDQVYRIVFISIFSLLTLVRSYYKIKAGTLRDHIFNRREGLLLVFLRWTLGIPMIAACMVFLLQPAGFGWMTLAVPSSLRLTGGLLAGLAVFLIFLVHRELGLNFSTTLVIRQAHSLVRTGPYRFVRHPMYTAYLCLFIGTLLFSRNWVLGLSGIAIIASLMVLRIGKEEALLLERFGADYELYRQQTGMFIPGFRRVYSPAFGRLSRGNALKARTPDAILPDGSDSR